MPDDWQDNFILAVALADPRSLKNYVCGFPTNTRDLG
jgi:hypothetical protein